MGIIIVDEATGKPKEPEKKQELVSQNNITSSVSTDLQRNAVHQVMGLERPSEQSRYSDEVDTILRWARSVKGETTRDGIKWAIRSLHNKIGSVPIMENKVPYLARFAYLELESKRIQNEKKLFSKKR